MEANRNRAQVHRLPTEDASQINLNTHTGKFDFSRQGNFITDYVAKRVNQHLYFTTDEEIKEGDWFYDEDINEVRNDDYIGGINIYKIIATTDPKISANNASAWDIKNHIQYPHIVPQPSQAFIKAYCEQGGFDEVDVETVSHYVLENCIGVYSRHKQSYTPIYFSRKGNPIVFADKQSAIDEGRTMSLDTLLDAKCVYVSKLKVDPIHNTITTHRIVKKMYSRDEVVELLTSLYDTCYSDGVMSVDGEEWIKENL